MAPADCAAERRRSQRLLDLHRRRQAAQSQTQRFEELEADRRSALAADFISGVADLLMLTQRKRWFIEQALWDSEAQPLRDMEVVERAQVAELDRQRVAAMEREREARRAAAEAEAAAEEARERARLEEALRASHENDVAEPDHDVEAVHGADEESDPDASPAAIVAAPSEPA
eukprot:CAMPEP_0174834606 /NCGR_PEP_ID=MMETSP1114-20130205/4924_1 /TAXON_ID=312471 /ORGANISM="Neobodo designis, Strain CCAP 1951/1" /LENGTH=172 /DNA_ID=CAMNT_0016068521 /DNA_START=113 /DNA_END=627 /DNA_ORIENTATION=-